MAGLLGPGRSHRSGSRSAERFVRQLQFLEQLREQFERLDRQFQQLGSEQQRLGEFEFRQIELVQYIWVR
jgi:hypothetical protein